MPGTAQMLGFIDDAGNYYEAEHNITGATGVPKRPSCYHDWVKGAWVERTAERIAADKAATLAALTKTVQAALDDEARSRGYDNVVSACSYAAAPNPFQSEGQAFVSWRGNVWAACYAMLAQVEAGTRPVPTAAEVLAELPQYLG